ncbi:DUF5011 domain-containing protein [Listeria sp. FSL L7-1582]|uniref:immunoglobulin-like domain-containing protein n=1 Tax=Listeria portnoyi TaxID=2713504 RepID=UPI00164DFEF9|nr:immunoglobulin-like domain-containing protein [Listeria portnoyi]MBC6309726.1 DUF5011 domain-containing protein [Listeria portnoyi]
MTKRNVLKKTGVALLTTAVVSSQLIATVPYNVFAAENVQATQTQVGISSKNLIQNPEFNNSTSWIGWHLQDKIFVKSNEDISFNGDGSLTLGSTIQQTITTIPGHQYQLSFAYARPGAQSQSAVLSTDVFDGGILNPKNDDTNRMKFGDLLNVGTLHTSEASYTGNFTAVSNESTLQFRGYPATDSDPTTVISDVKIIDLDAEDTAPVISGAANKTIPSGTAFDVKAGVTATDKEDGNLTSAITVSGTVNSNVPGKYPITYSVKDSGGNTTTKTITVTVSPSAKDITINKITTKDTIVTGTGVPGEKVMVFGADTGADFGATPAIVDANGQWSFKMSRAQPENRPVGVRFVDYPDVTAQTTVVSDTNPVISGAADKSIKAGTAFDAKAGVTATDKEDGSLTSAITVSGTVNSNVPGTYPITYTVKDSDGNTTTKSITITVTSNDKPVISGAANKTIDQGTAFNAKTGVTATDKEDGNLTSAITVSGSVNSNVPGTYPLTYSVKDSDGNTTTKSITITVKAAATQGTVTTNDFTINKDSYITGTYTGDVSKMSVIVNGKKLTTINTSGSPFKYYAGRNITGVNDVVEVVVYDATGKELDRSTVTVKKEINTQGTITANPFVIGKDGYVKGNLTGDVAKISMIVNGKEFSRIDKAAGAYQYYAGGKILTENDDVTMVAYDAQGKELNRVNVAVSKNDAPEVGTITANTFTIGKDGYVTGTFTGKAARLGLIINGTALSRIDVASSPFKYYVGSKIASTNDAVTAVIYDAKGREMDRVNVKVEKAAPVTSGTIAANAFQVGGTDSYIHGTTTGDVVKVKMMVNGTTISQRAVNADGSYDYYARPSITSVNDDVYMVGFDATGKELSRVKVALTAAKGTVATSPFTVGGADKYLHGTATGDVVKVQVFINGTLDSLAVVKADGTFQYYLNNKVTSTSDKLEVVGLSNNGQELDRQAVTLN